MSRRCKNARLEARLLAIGVSESIAFATPRRRPAPPRRIGGFTQLLGWLAIAALSLAYIAGAT